MAAAAAAQPVPLRPARKPLLVRIWKEKREPRVELTSGQKLTLATPGCTWCHGTGNWPLRYQDACKCVERAVFRVCLQEYFTILDKQTAGTQIHYHVASNRRAGIYWGRRGEEYIADIELTARRVLTDVQFKIFRLHFLMGLEYRDCCPLLRLSRGNFFHGVYKVQELLGRAFYTTRPYALFPIREYFQ